MILLAAVSRFMLLFRRYSSSLSPFCLSRSVVKNVRHFSEGNLAKEGVWILINKCALFHPGKRKLSQARCSINVHSVHCIASVISMAPEVVVAPMVGRRDSTFLTRQEGMDKVRGESEVWRKKNRLGEVRLSPCPTRLVRFKLRIFSAPARLLKNRYPKGTCEHVWYCSY